MGLEFVAESDVANLVAAAHGPRRMLRVSESTSSVRYDAPGRSVLTANESTLLTDLRCMYIVDDELTM